MLFTAPPFRFLGGEEKGGNGAEIEGRASSAEGCISGKCLD